MTPLGSIWLRPMSPSIIVECRRHAACQPLSSPGGSLPYFLPLPFPFPFSLSRNAENMCSSRSLQKTAPSPATRTSSQHNTFISQFLRYLEYNSPQLFLTSFGPLQSDTIFSFPCCTALRRGVCSLSLSTASISAPH